MDSEIYTCGSKFVYILHMPRLYSNSRLIGISSILLHASWLDRLIVYSIIVQLHCVSVLLPCQVYICTSWVVVFLPCQLETCIYWIVVHTA